MATSGDGRAPYESRGDGEKSRKRPFRPELNEEPQNALQEAGQLNSTGVSDQGGNSASISAATRISEFERMFKQMTFTRSETQRLTALLHSRTCDDVVVESDATNLPITPMSSPQQTTIENLPRDILFKIFIRLLAKQLAQMRCVSKSWNALLSQSSFIKSHLHHSIHNNDRILMAFYYQESTSTSDHKLFSAYPCQSPHIELTNFIKLPPRPENTYKTIKVVGSVHGLICSRYGDDVIQIWNPSLSAVSTLPPYSFPYCDCYEIHFRFGFDPNTNDYKVIKVTGLIQELETSEEEEDDVPSFLHVIEKWLQIEIYSMRTGSWKLITHRFPSHITRIFSEDTVCVDGHDGRLHWVGYTNEKLDSNVVVAFDLGSETFLEMNLPDPAVDYNRSNTLGVLAGKLCVVSRDGKSGIDVWVMNEYGVAESWVKRHVFCFSHCLGDIFTGFTSQNEFLIEDRDDRLVLYDLVADKAKILEKNLHPKHGVRRIVRRIVEYVDSLVWVAPPRNIS